MASTAHWWDGRANDTQAADWAGWALAHGYGNDITAVPGLPQNTWFIHVGHRIVAARTAGVVLSGVPLQWLLTPFRLSPDTPGVLTAVLLSAAAMANVAVLLHRLGGSMRQVLMFMGALTFGTSIWTVCGAELWTHSVDIFWLSCLLLALQSHRVWLAAATVLPLVWTRPHLAVSVAVLGTWLGWHLRSVRPVVVLAGAGIGSFAGLVAWNTWMFAGPSNGGPYQGALGRAAAAPDSSGLLSVLENVAGAAISPERGFFLYSPITLVAVVAIVRSWRVLPGAARASLLAGLAYLVVQFRLNRFDGGGASFSNRLVVETFVLSAPAAFLAYRRWAQDRPGVATVAYWLTAFSVAVHLAGALLAPAPVMAVPPTHPWSDWILVDAIRDLPAGARATGLATAALVACFAAAKLVPLLSVRRPDPGPRLPEPASARRTGL